MKRQRLVRFALVIVTTGLGLAAYSLMVALQFAAV